MICSQCRTSLFSRLPFSRIPSSTFQSSRYASSLISRPQQQRAYSTPTPPTQAESDASTSADATVAATTTGAAAGSSAAKITSSVPAGTRLAGLNYFKNKPEVVAMEDSEYPDWLWDLLEDPNVKATKSGPGQAEVAAMNKKQRKRFEKKLLARLASEPPVIPLHEQSIDVIPANLEQSYETATTGVEARKDITKSARVARRKSIKEANFLKGL